MFDCERINKKFDRLVPETGKADSLAGEIIRATARIGYRFYNDGDMINIDYGKKTCNAAARFLWHNTTEEIGNTVLDLWGEYSEGPYEAKLEKLVNQVCDYIEENPQLETASTRDMWEWFDPNEDNDDEDEDE